MEKLEETKRKTPLEHFQDIKELETADGPLVTVEDLLPYKCEKVEQALTEKQNLESFTRLVVEKNLIIAVIEFYAFNRNYEKNIALKVYNSTVNKEQELTQEEFDFIKEMIAKYGKRI